MSVTSKRIKNELNLDYPNGSYSIHREYIELRNLWRAVVMQALYDMRLKPTHRKNRAARRRAIDWVDLTNQGFLDTCALAEFDPVKVVTIAYDEKPLQVSGVKFIF